MRRTSSTIPFGYKLNEDNQSYLVPVEAELEMLDKILPLVKRQDHEPKRRQLVVDPRNRTFNISHGVKENCRKKMIGTLTPTSTWQTRTVTLNLKRDGTPRKKGGRAKGSKGRGYNLPLRN